MNQSELPTPHYKKDLEILLVDSDSVTCMLHKTKLKGLPSKHKISVYHDGREALDYLLENSLTGTDFLILLEIDLEQMSGWDFLEECSVMELPCDLHVIMLSHSVSIDDKIKAITYYQVLDYFVKPFNDSQVQNIPQMKKLRPYFN